MAHKGQPKVRPLNAIQNTNKRFLSPIQNNCLYDADYMYLGCTFWIAGNNKQKLFNKLFPVWAQRIGYFVRTVKIEYKTNDKYMEHSYRDIYWAVLKILHDLLPLAIFSVFLLDRSLVFYLTHYDLMSDHRKSDPWNIREQNYHGDIAFSLLGMVISCQR